MHREITRCNVYIYKFYRVAINSLIYLILGGHKYVNNFWYIRLVVALKGSPEYFLRLSPPKQSMRGMR